jgi:predicted O-methyltransferase YrrM
MTASTSCLLTRKGGTKMPDKWSSSLIVIEVGCWLGSSTRHIAKTIPETGIVFAVDHWLGSPNEDNSVFDMPNLYRQFLSNAIHEGLAHKIIPIRMPSVEAAHTLDVRPDLVYIDATHAYNTVYKDLSLWFPFVKGHGVLCGDDYLWGEDLPVQRAVHRFAEKNDLIVHADGWFWYLEER